MEHAYLFRPKPWQKTALACFYCSVGASLTIVSQLLEVQSLQSILLWYDFCGLYRHLLAEINKSHPYGYGIVFDAQFKNNCTLMQFMYVLMQFSAKHERTSTISSCKQSPIFCVSFWRPETWTNWFRGLIRQSRKLPSRRLWVELVSCYAHMRMIAYVSKFSLCKTFVEIFSWQKFPWNSMRLFLSMHLKSYLNWFLGTW